MSLKQNWLKSSYEIEGRVNSKLEGKIFQFQQDYA